MNKIFGKCLATILCSAALLAGCDKSDIDPPDSLQVAAPKPDTREFIDCPLRDEPYSIESPLMDILLKPEATEVVNRHLGDALDKLPPTFASKESPSFSAIMNVQKLISLGGGTGENLPLIDSELRALEVTDEDRTLRCARYDTVPPELEIPEGKPRILLFEKMTGFRDGPSVEAARDALEAMAASKGWALVYSENGAAITPALLEKFDGVIWNNISGDVLTLSQREAFKTYIENGGAYIGIHGAGGDPAYFWDWYVDVLLGARFIGHTFDPQFQDARVVVEKAPAFVSANLPADWVMKDEWYAFASNPRDQGAIIFASLDETSYSPLGRGGLDVSMGGDHPIAWGHCIGKGRSFYSAIGHLPETYSQPHHLQLLENGILWALGSGEDSTCAKAELE